MKNYKILIQYDGTRYKGWQIQNSTDMTIQGKLQAVLEQLMGCPIEVIGSGRTDAGVHAIGQVANFHIEDNFEKEEILAYLNRYLPMDIAVLSIEEVPERFHSRFSAIKKTYVYRIHTSTISDVFERKYKYTYTEKLDIARMKEAAAHLIGTHDFMAFCGNKKMKKSTVRTIKSFTVERMGEEIRFTVTGNGFLHNMVRILVGTLVEVGRGERTAESIPALFGAKREEAGFLAPGKGLCLMEVRY